MTEFGQLLTLHRHFQQHLIHGIPVQVLRQGVHVDIGTITSFTKHFVEIQGTLYNRNLYTFVSTPGY